MNSLNIVGRYLAEVKRLPRGDVRQSAKRGWILAKQMLSEIFGLSEPDRQALRDTLTREEVGFLFGIAQSCAEYAVREQSEVYLREGLLALIFEEKRDDARESVMHLCLLDHSAAKLGLEMICIYQPLRVLATREMSSFLDDWFREGTKDIGMMGYAEGVSKEGQFTYVRMR